MAVPYISFDQGRLLLENTPQGYKDIQGNLYTQSYGAQGSGYYAIPTTPIAPVAPIAPAAPAPTAPATGGAIQPQNQTAVAPQTPQAQPVPQVPQNLTGQSTAYTGAQSYVVNPGDTLSKLALKYGVRIGDITGYRSGNPNLIYPGENLTINTGGAAPTGNQPAPPAPPAAPAAPGTPETPATPDTPQTPEIDFQTQVRDLMKEFGVSPASANTNPFSALTDYLNQAYTNLGLTDLKTQIGNTTKQVQEIETELATKEASINDNPFISEGLRSKQVIKARELSDRKKDALINRLRLDESLYEKGVEQAKFVAQQAMTLTHQQQQTQQDYLFKALDIALKEAEARAKLKEPTKPTSEMQEYNFAVKQGFKGSFLEYKRAVSVAQRKPETLEDLTKLTGTQLNKGAIEAGKSIEEFKRLSPEAQRFYIFKDIDSEKKKLDKAIDEGQDPEILRQGIDNSNFPREVKNELRSYIDKQASGEQNLPWWRRIF